MRLIIIETDVFFLTFFLVYEPMQNQRINETFHVDIFKTEWEIENRVKSKFMYMARETAKLFNDH